MICYTILPTQNDDHQQHPLIFLAVTYTFAGARIHSLASILQLSSVSSLALAMHAQHLHRHLLLPETFDANFLSIQASSAL